MTYGEAELPVRRLREAGATDADMEAITEAWEALPTDRRAGEAEAMRRLPTSALPHRVSGWAGERLRALHSPPEPEPPQPPPPSRTGVSGVSGVTTTRDD